MPSSTDFVDRFARRVSNFDRGALADIKHFVNEATFPADAAFPLQMEAFARNLTRPNREPRVRANLICKSGVMWKCDSVNASHFPVVMAKMRFNKLSVRDKLRRVEDLRAMGYTNREIADLCGLDSPQRVSYYNTMRCLFDSDEGDYVLTSS